MKNRKGVSLVEVLVGLVLLSVAALAISSTLGIVSSKKMRSPNGSLDLQAADSARQVLEELRNSVGTSATVQQRLVDISHGGSGAPCPVTALVGDPCGSGTKYVSTKPGVAVVPPEVRATWLALPSGDLLSSAGSRSYMVWDISDGVGGVAYKKVTVSLTWTDPS